MREKRRTKQIRRIFWEAKEIPYANKASYLLGDLTLYGVSRCKQLVMENVNRGWYEFDIYRARDHVVTLVVELPVDFSVRDIERTILDVWVKGGAVCATDSAVMKRWERRILPAYGYDHAKFSALRFLEALRKALLMQKACKAQS